MSGKKQVPSSQPEQQSPPMPAEPPSSQPQPARTVAPIFMRGHKSAFGASSLSSKKKKDRRKSGSSGFSSSQPTNNSSSFVTCPLCGKDVVAFTINSHIDSGCKDDAPAPSSAPWPFSQPTSSSSKKKSKPTKTAAQRIAELSLSLPGMPAPVYERPNRRQSDPTSFIPSPSFEFSQDQTRSVNQGSPTALLAPHENSVDASSHDSMDASDHSSTVMGTAHSFFTSGAKPASAFEANKRRLNHTHDGCFVLELSSLAAMTTTTDPTSSKTLLHTPTLIATSTSTATTTSSAPLSSQLQQSEFTRASAMTDCGALGLRIRASWSHWLVTYLADTRPETLGARPHPIPLDRMRAMSIKDHPAEVDCDGKADDSSAVNTTRDSRCVRVCVGATDECLAPSKGNDGAHGPNHFSNAGSDWDRKLDEVMDWRSPEHLSSYRRSFDLSPSMLKSLLQKNVRMCRPDAAVRCALQLCVDGTFLDFLRRLAVIILEDAILHPLFPFIVWLTVACHKGFIPTVRMVNTCLECVYEVAAVRVKDDMVWGDQALCGAVTATKSNQSTTTDASHGPSSSTGIESFVVDPPSDDMTSISDTASPQKLLDHADGPVEPNEDPLSAVDEPSKGSTAAPTTCLDVTTETSAIVSDGAEGGNKCVDDVTERMSDRLSLHQSIFWRLENPDCRVSSGTLAIEIREHTHTHTSLCARTRVGCNWHKLL